MEVAHPAGPVDADHDGVLVADVAVEEHGAGRSCADAVGADLAEGRVRLVVALAHDRLLW